MQTPNPILMRSANISDAEAIAHIYNYYIAQTVVTFEVDEISAIEMARRIGEIQTSSFPWLVAKQNRIVTGYAYADVWKSRSAYRFSAEVTVYLDHQYVGQGIGAKLYGALLERLRGQGIHTAIAGIALPNPGSVALHEKFGFQKSAHYKQVGFKFGQWIDVGYWQVIL